TNPYYPSEDEWQALGLDSSKNVKDLMTGELLEFQGHLRYDLHKAWALMELAGYAMKPFREYYGETTPAHTETREPFLSPYMVILAIVIFSTIRFANKLKQIHG
ncbi:MAG: hypothetical protein ACXAEL_09355, partial [Candidatus Hodarchaeales archaeon]